MRPEISSPSSTSLHARTCLGLERALLPASLVLKGARECSAPAFHPVWKTTPMSGKQAEHAPCSASHHLLAHPGQYRCASFPGGRTGRLKELYRTLDLGFEPRCVCGAQAWAFAPSLYRLSSVCPSCLGNCHSLLRTVPSYFPLLCLNTDGLGCYACFKVLCRVGEEQGVPPKWR